MHRTVLGDEQGPALEYDRSDRRGGATADVAEIAPGRTAQEAATAAFLEHPNIVPVHAFEEDSEGQLQLAMKLVKGRSWHEMLDADFRPGLQVVGSGDQIGEGHKLQVLDGVLMRDDIVAGELE